MQGVSGYHLSKENHERETWEQSRNRDCVLTLVLIFWWSHISDAEGTELLGVLTQTNNVLSCQLPQHHENDLEKYFTQQLSLIFDWCKYIWGWVDNWGKKLASSHFLSQIIRRWISVFNLDRLATLDGSIFLSDLCAKFCLILTDRCQLDTGLWLV